MNVANGRRPNILVVDDQPENLRLLNTILSENDYEVRPVTSGRQALQVAERSAPDLILLDITMPDMDGYEVCRELKLREGLRDVPVIFITALTDTEDKLKAFSAGGVDYIPSPSRSTKCSRASAFTSRCAGLGTSYPKAMTGCESWRWPATIW